MMRIDEARVLKLSYFFKTADSDVVRIWLQLQGKAAADSGSYSLLLAGVVSSRLYSEEPFFSIMSSGISSLTIC